MRAKEEVTTAGAGGGDLQRILLPGPGVPWLLTRPQTRIGWEVAAAVSISALRNAAATHEDRVRNVSAVILFFLSSGSWLPLAGG